MWLWNSLETGIRDSYVMSKIMPYFGLHTSLGPMSLKACTAIVYDTHVFSIPIYLYALFFSSMTPDVEPRASVVQSPPPLPPDLHEDMAAATVREVLYSCRENVCFLLEIYRQAFLLPFTHAPTIRKTANVYRDWITMSVSRFYFTVFIKLLLLLGKTELATCL